MTDIAALIAFRICFGVTMIWHVWRYFENDWIYTHYIGPEFHFTYFGFSWVRPLTGTRMYGVFLAMGLSAVCVTIGFAYRLSMTALFVLFTYVFLLDQAYYLNHHYLTCVFALLLIFMPANRAVAVDAWLFPTTRRDWIPNWAPQLLRWQLAIVYVYAAIAKMNGDWLQGQPMRMWLTERQDLRLLGPLFPVGHMFSHEAVVMGFAIGGLLFDLLVVPLLLWRPTRRFGMAWVVAFHATNALLFDIGYFPWFMLMATLLFFGDDWPRHIFNWPRTRTIDDDPCDRPTPRRERWTHYLVAGYLAFQLLCPLRHFLYPGSVHWTEEGHRFAWHMKLRAKEGDGRFIVEDATGERTTVDARDQLTERQMQKMLTRPDMILQFAHHLAQEHAGDEAKQKVFAEIQCRLNARPRQPLIDARVDLGSEPRNLRHARWIVPLE